MKKSLSFTALVGLIAITFAFTISKKQYASWFVFGVGEVSSEQVDSYCPGGSVECAYLLLEGYPVQPPVYKRKLP